MNKNTLSKPLTEDMIRTAGEIYQRLPAWQTTDRTLIMLNRQLPGTGFEEILLKAIAVNTLYGTFVYAIWKAAVHIHQLMEKVNPNAIDADFVDKLAVIPGTATKGSKKDRAFSSFASKFAHFFIDENRFPIKDSYAEDMIRYHLGRGNWLPYPERPYFEYVTNFNRLRESCGYNGSLRELDRYLWLAGQFKVWTGKKEDAEINQEVKEFFKNPNNENLISRAFAT